MKSIQTKLIKKLLTDTRFYIKTMGLVTDDDFDEYPTITNMMKEFTSTFEKGKVPNINELSLYIEGNVGLEDEKKEQLTTELKDIEATDIEEIHNEKLWETTFIEFIKKKKLHKLLYDGVDYIDGKSQKSYEDFLEDMHNIAGLSIDKGESHDYIEDAEERFLWLNNVTEQMIESNIDMLNKIGFGSFEKLSIFLGETNIGKCWDGDTMFEVYVEEEHPLVSIN